MAELGFFNGQRVELIDGEVILMSTQEAGHATAVELVVRALEKAFGEGYHVRDQNLWTSVSITNLSLMRQWWKVRLVTTPKLIPRWQFSSLRWLFHRLTTTALSKVAFTQRRAFKSFGF